MNVVDRYYRYAASVCPRVEATAIYAELADHHVHVDVSDALIGQNGPHSVRVDDMIDNERG